ncbi:MAG: 16S rRNA (cytidine(1402)-2'-O)-methyltransferase [Acidimicrobiia bacterium]
MSTEGARTTPGTLFVVPTPIGNLGDMTFRAVDALRDADRIFAEDTRRTRQLMTHFEIPAKGRLHAMPAARERSRIEMLLDALARGERVAIVSDAGMPGISDPGALLVRAALDEGHAVDVLPGASAVPVAVVASGIPADHFTFYGFPPRKATERRTVLTRAMERDEAAIFYEAPGRIRALISTVVEIDAHRAVAVGRELTKMHETWIRSTAGEAAETISATEPRGEYVVVIAAQESQRHSLSAPPEIAEIRAALEATSKDARPKERAKLAASALGIPVKVAYDVLVGADSGAAGGAVGAGAPPSSAVQ